MNKMKRLAAALLALLTLFSLAACGQTNVEETEAPEYVYKATYSEVKNDYPELQYINPMLVTKDGFYCINNEKIGERELDEGETLEYDGQLDIYGSRLYLLSLDGTVKKLEQFQPLELPTEEGHEIGGGIENMVQTDEGFLTLENVYDAWSDAGEDAERYSEEWYASWHYLNRFFLRRLDAEGRELSRIELDTEPLRQSPDDYFYFNYMAAAGDGRALLSYDGGICFFDVNTGKMTGKIDGINLTERLLTLHDGSVAAAYYGDTGERIARIDLEKGALAESTPIQGDLYRAVSGGGDYDLYFSNGVNFFGYHLESGTADKLFNWINCDVDNDNINGFTVTDDGRIIAISSEWKAVNGGLSADMEYSMEISLITLEKVPSSSLPKKETITLATQSLDWDARKQIIEFNRSHDSVRIELQDYSEYNTGDDYSAGLTKLRTELMAGNCPDIIDLSGLPAKQLAAKGVLADLYPLLDADAELGREDFFPNVLKALESNGKLYSSCSSFYILTAIGASQIVGTEPGWTYAELMNALSGMETDCTVFGVYETRYDVLQTCLTLDMDRYVDWNTGEVNFDSPDFIALLNFARNFPAEFDWDSYEWTEEDDSNIRVRDGRQLLISEYISGFDEILSYENIFGGLDGFTFIGYPASEGVGSMLWPNTGYGISSKCRNKEAAWEFVRVFLTEEYQDENTYNIPSNIHSYEKKKAALMTPSYVKDENGRIMLDENGEKRMEEKGGYWDSAKQEWVSVYAFSQEEIDKVEAVILSTERVYAMDEAINDIVKEQVEAFFAGQRSAEDVAKLIQSKAKIYVNEQR